MRWSQAEFILKGIFLGLLAFAALQEPDWHNTGVLALYKRLREAFPDFTPEIHWQRVDGDVVTTFKTYHGTHRGNFLGIAGTGTKVSFETVDAMRVVNGKITEHWGVANLYSVMQQLGAIAPLPQG